MKVWASTHQGSILPATQNILIYTPEHSRNEAGSRRPCFRFDCLAFIGQPALGTHLRISSHSPYISSKCASQFYSLESTFQHSHYQYYLKRAMLIHRIFAGVNRVLQDLGFSGVLSTLSSGVSTTSTFRSTSFEGPCQSVDKFSKRRV